MRGSESFLFLAVMALSTACYAQAPPANGAAPVEEVIISVDGLYGDWKMVLPEWPGFDKPVTGDFCTFKKRDGGVSITCADGFLQDVPEVALNADNRLRMRWGGALNHITYDAAWQENGTYAGELTQTQMGVEAHSFKANMERISGRPANEAPPDSVAALNASHAGVTMKYFGKLMEQKNDVRMFPDVFKISNAQNAEQWCMVYADADGPAKVRCRDIP